MSCLDDNTAATFVQGLVGPVEAAEIEAHLESCSTCRELIVGFARTFGSSSHDVATEGDSAPRALPALQRGERLDRYVVLECVGTGAMSVVYAAYDPELDRKVALKVMRAVSGHERLLVEARAIAKLSHPHVVNVYDARVLEGELFLAMELVDGCTLREWLERNPSRWRAALALCIQAGRGLAAAHRAGIVHRDFKPENVLVRARDSHALVADFGLATRDGVTRGEPIAPEAMADWPTGLTRTGSIVGTPLYMAPELMDGGAASPSSDQYAFCVVLHEALFGARPFASTAFAELLAEKRRGPTIAKLPRGVPRAIAEVVRRGLAPHPDERWPALESLLARLERRDARTPMIAAGVLGAALVGAIAMRTADAESPPCTDAEAALATTWNPAARERADEGLRAAGSAITERAREQVLGRLDAWSLAWSQGWTRACRATRVAGVQSEALMDRRFACLDRHRRDMGALVDVVAAGQGDSAVRAVEAIDALRDVSECDDTDALLRRPDDPPASEDARSAASTIAATRANRLAGAYAAAATLGRDAVHLANVVEHPPLVAQATTELALALAAAGDANAAEPMFVEAITTASAARADEIAAQAWVGLAGIHATTQARYADAERVGQFADAALRRLDDPPALRRRWALAMGAAALGRGDHDVALAHYDAALALARTMDDPIGLTDTLEQLARVELARGNVDAALGHMDRVLEIRTAELGEQHPRVADALVNYGNVLHDAGRWEDAAKRFRTALDRLEAALGPTHPNVAGALVGLAVVERRLGDLDGARAGLLRALAIREAALGGEHPDVAHVLVALANVEYDREEYAMAREYLERALAIYAVHFRDDHPRVVAALGNLASIENDSGRLADAERTYRRVLAVREAKLGPDHPEVAFTLANLGRVVAREGRVAEARPMLERAVSIAQAKLGERHPFVAFARDSLAELPQLAAGAER